MAIGRNARTWVEIRKRLMDAAWQIGAAQSHEAASAVADEYAREIDDAIWAVVRETEGGTPPTREVQP